MIDIFTIILKIAMMWVPRAIKRVEDRDYVKKLLAEALNHYQQRALDPASLRKASQDLDAVLEKKWQDKFGSGSGA